MSTTASNPTRAVQQADAADHASSEVLARVASDLADRYAGVFSPETVGRYVRESHDLLIDHSPLTRFVPSRTATFAAIRLEALATEVVPSRCSSSASRTPAGRSWRPRCSSNWPAIASVCAARGRGPRAR
ncbi:three-helix bundle dimerization domain-containing protein [Agromyces sp. NPDC004153]